MSAQRRSPAIPLSPSSPPESGFKQRRKRRLSDDSQYYPSTPPFMSVATKSCGNSYGNGQSSEGPNPLSPPTSSYTQQSTSTQPTQHSFPAPTASASGSSDDVSLRDQHRDKRQKLETEVSTDNPKVQPSTDTNHDQHSESAGRCQTDGVQPQVSAPIAPKHKPDSGRAGMNDLRMSPGEGYLLCKSCKLVALAVSEDRFVCSMANIRCLSVIKVAT